MAVEDSVAQDQIRAFIERIERLEEEKAALAEDIKSIYAEAKGNGFHTKTLRKVVNIRKQDANERMEQEALLELYMSALGMVPAPPSYDEERGRLNSLASKIEADLRKPKAEPTPDPIAALKTNPDLHIVSASEIKPKPEPQPTKAAGQAQEDAGSFSDQLVPSLPGAEGAEDRDQITEPQSLTQAGSDLTNSQALNGQVATHSDIGNPISTEARDETGHVAATAPDQGLADQHDADNRNPGGENVDAPDVPATPTTEHASGKSVGASASAAPVKYAAPGIVTYENHPPEGVERSAISIAFGNMGQDGALIQDDLANGRAQPIVKQGKVILDGWARYMTARTMTELDGSPLTYAVVQYDGTDPLIDVIRWNVEGRMLNEQQKRVIAQTLTRQHPKRKDDIYRAFELWMEPV